MKIRALTLENVRKFAGQRARISDIGDGVSVISEANEFGKSTFFDALHALMFTRHGAAGKDVQALRPPAGGAVRVSAEVELPGGLFTLEKSFLSQKSASVRDASGRLIAQQDEAERWIAQLMDNGLDGPAGLLWVRQGVTALEPADASGKERTQLLGARRDLLSTVAGEIDMVTGGRRMDRVIRAAHEAFAALATATGRPRAGGPWAAAIDEAEALETSRARLAEEVAALRGALDRRAQVARQLAALSEPDAQAARRSALAEARGADTAARAHAERLSTARTESALKALERDRARAALDALVARADRLRAARVAQGRSADAIVEATEALLLAEDRHAVQQATRARAVAEAERLRHAHRLAQNANLRTQLTEMRAKAVKAEEAARRQRDRAEAARATLVPLTVTAELLREIEAAEDALRRTRAERDAGVSMTLEYTGEARLRLDGEALSAGPHPVGRPLDIDMPGIGRMRLDPGPAAQDSGAVTRAEKTLSGALDKAGVRDADAARAAARLRETAAAERTLAEQMFAALAPDGLAALQATVAEAQARLAALGEAPEDAPEHGPLTDDLDGAERAAKAAQADADAARDVQTAARTALAEARARGEAAQGAFDSALANFGDADAHDTEKQAAARALALAETALTAAGETVEALERDAPDFETVAATLARAEGAVAQAENDTRRLQTELSALGAEIRTRAEDGVEEALAETEDRHAAASARAARFGAEVAALTLLLKTLEDTRGAAQEAYFGPIQRELKPLLAILHADAALSFDPATLLPAQMTRGGAAETLEQLSGGTREQIAVLTRLAFARLFARAGKPMPVILDDALVYSDDDRIERMFTALHRVAQGQQVIVFTCRQRAFGTLGGSRPEVTIGPIA